MDQKELDGYWSFFDKDLKALPEIYQRKACLAFCELVKFKLDELGVQAFDIVKDLAAGKKHGRKAELYQKRLQAQLPENDFHPYSVLIWALMPNTPPYPPYMAAGMAGLNVVDLQIAKLHELVALARKVVKVT